MSSKNYEIGRRFEYRTQNYFRKIGYYVIRAYGSKGLYDLIAVPPMSRLGQTLLIQCKKNGYIHPKELAKLKEHDKWNGLILIAYSDKKRKLRFRTLENKSFEL